jgi:hypothetical protein
MPNTNTTWAKEDIGELAFQFLEAHGNHISVMFLLEVARWKDDVRKISVGLKSKVSSAQQPLHSLL